MVLSRDDARYICANKDYKPWNVGKVVKISGDFGIFLQQKYQLDFIPKLIHIGQVIGEIDRKYHCFIQFRKTVPPQLEYVSKNHILTPFNVKNYKEMDIDFDYYDRLSEPFNRKLKPHQKEGIQFLVCNKRAVLADSMGLGKELAKDTLVMTRRGLVPIRLLSMEDMVYGADGKLHAVKGIYPQGVKELYEINFSDNHPPVKCGKEHLWIVVEKGYWHTLSTQEIITKLENGEKIEIPLTSCVDNTDDCMQSGFLCADELIRCLKFYNGYKDDEYILQRIYATPYERRLKILYDLFNLFNKDYGDYPTVGRRELFGYMQDERVCGISQSIIRSLGGVVSKKSDNHCLFFTLKNNPFQYMTDRVGLHKRIEWEDRHEVHYKTQRFITSVSSCGEDEAWCISVDSPDGSYLIEDCVVTHNTTQAIVAGMETKAEHVLIVTTANMKAEWYDELQYYVPKEDITLVQGTTWDKTSRFTIINYDILDNFYKFAYRPETVKKTVQQDDGTCIEVEEIEMVKSYRKEDVMASLAESKLFTENFDCVIIDEAHKLSTETSQRYKITDDLLKKLNPNYIFLITGTPLTNNPANLYNVLNLIKADVTEDFDYYMRRYCSAYKCKSKTGHRFMKKGNPSNLDELGEKIKHLYLRRLISDIPGMIKKNIFMRVYSLTPAQTLEYNNLWEEYIKQREAEGKSNLDEYRTLVEAMVVRKWLALQMIPNTIKVVEQILARGEKIVVICSYTDEIEKLKEYFGSKAVVYDGTHTPTPKQKQKAKDAFINDPNVKVFIGQYISCGVGLTLVVAKTLVFNSFSYVAADNQQAEDRIYRINQTKDVNILYQMFNDTISQKVYNTVLTKSQIMNTLIKSENEKTQKITST